MIQHLIPGLVGKNERELRKIRPLVRRINDIETQLQGEPVEALRERTARWRAELARYLPVDIPPRGNLERLDLADLKGLAALLSERFTALRKEFPSLPREVEPTAEAIHLAREAFDRVSGNFAAARARYLESILPEAYAVVKNGARRLCGTEVDVCGQIQTWDMVHFDVQLIGGIAIHRGLIAEMQTGEGKTLVATLPVYLNALSGLGVHVVTVNDYLARRDSTWMGELFRFLGLSVGCILNDMEPPQRRAAYACDITYGTNSELGFDYLRDNGLASTPDEQVQRGHHFAIIDEIDSILIDDARTPLIISIPVRGSTERIAANRPRVEKLVRRQTELCNRIASEAEKALAAGDFAAAGTALYKLKLGQPRHRRFLRLMEDPENRRLLDKTELSYIRGAFRKNIHQLKEELYFCVSEKDRDADLMEKGRLLLSPDDPDAFTVPDLSRVFERIDADDSLDAAAKTNARNAAAQLADERAAEIHGISQLLKAWCLHERDVHYVVRSGKIVIIDESTGREMPGRRWSDGLHQAVEAKERVKMQEETRTCATITIQNYFRLYDKLAGMTGTAETEAAEFHDIYQLDVLPIPTHRPCVRVDENDRVFRTRADKFQSVVSRIAEVHATGQPVLVGTASVDSSETLARLLKRAGIRHTVLNAKNHESEAAIVAKAGERGAVTVSTNMAGRGTDIRLGEGVAELGGLFVMATERHSSRRVDRQLRGRCARQGDPGRAQFFLSLEDELMRNHADPGAMAAMIEQAGRGRGPSFSLGKLVEAAQMRVEQQGYKSRKRILDFDDVMNLQREIVYGYRHDVASAGDVDDLVRRLVSESIAAAVASAVSEMDPDEPDWSGFVDGVRGNFAIDLDGADLVGRTPAQIEALVVDAVLRAYRDAAAALPPDLVEANARRSILMAVDRHWQTHLDDMEELRDGVFLRAQGQKNPLVEYKNEAYGLFNGLMATIHQDALRGVFRMLSLIAARIQRVPAAV